MQGIITFKMMKNVKMSHFTVTEIKISHFNRILIISG